MSEEGLMLRLVSASISASRKAGQIIRQITQKGELKVKDKVWMNLVRPTVDT